MKHLPTLLLTLLVSGGLWADDELPVEFVSLEKSCSADYNSKECEQALDLVYGNENYNELVTTAYEPVKTTEGMIKHLWNVLYGLSQNPNASEKQKYEIGFNFLIAFYKHPFECFEKEILEGECQDLHEDTLRNRLMEYQEQKGLSDDKKILNNSFKLWVEASRDYYSRLTEARSKWEEEFQLASKRMAEEAKRFKIEVKKGKCRDYGFKDDTDGMGLCLIELDKLAELEKQTKILQSKQYLSFNSANTTNPNNVNYAEELNRQQKQRESQALINLGAAILGAGVPRTNTPKAPITTYPNSFSSSLTVPSNQVCPILSTPITKQEIRGANRICYYQ